MSTTVTNTIETNNFIFSDHIEWENVGEGVRRKIICFDKNIMMVKVEFETGGIGSLHKHPHIQMSYVESGTFEVEVDGVKKLLNKGDVFYVHTNLIHGVVCLDKGALIDFFNPMREDFIQ
jgi:quercetin dioxygenase-like cupin family protein